MATRLKDLVRKYPFVTSSKTDATLDELGGIFRPTDGRLAAFYEGSLKNYLDKQGSQYVRKSDSKVRITDGFLLFFNRAMAFSAALYKNGATNPSLTYSMRALPAEGLKTVVLSLDGQECFGPVRMGGPRRTSSGLAPAYKKRISPAAWADPSSASSPMTDSGRRSVSSATRTNSWPSGSGYSTVLGFAPGAILATDPAR